MASPDVEQALRLAQVAAPHLHGAEQRAWFARLEAAAELWRSALTTCEQDGDALTGLRLAVLLSWFWFRCRHAAEARRWLEAFLAASPHHEQAQALRADGLFWAGHFACAEVQPDQAMPFFDECLAISTASASRPTPISTRAASTRRWRSSKPTTRLSPAPTS